MTATARQHRPDRPRPAVSVAEISDMLVARIEEVVARYAPPAPGSYREGHNYWTLAPFRADRNVGSFKITMSGPDAGHWIDFANPEEWRGDLIDLIGLSAGLTPAQAVRQARALVGLDTEDPAARRRLEAQRAQLAEARAKAQAEDRARAERKRAAAQALWLSAQARISGTPVDAYLQGRGLDLSALGWQPGALRFHPECALWRRAETVDPETGEVTASGAWEPAGALPAMVTAICDLAGNHIGTHRTYLAQDARGQWRKAPLADAKKVLGAVVGGCIRLSSGRQAGRGGGETKGKPLNACPPGTRVVLAEGIETGLSVLMLRPHLRVLAAVSLGNMATVRLPANVAEVVLVGDADTSPAAQAGLQRAIEAHAAAGRRVFLVQSPEAGQDFNDRLRAALAAESGGE